MLDHYALPRYEPVWGGNRFLNGPLYQIEVVNGHLYYHLPPGSVVLSAPFVAIMNLGGVSTVNPDGTYSAAAEIKIETTLAALLMALLAVIFFSTARLLLPRSLSVAIALTGALGTQVYSTATRALWSDTWGVLLVGIVIYFLLAHEANRNKLLPILIASLLAWSYFSRPTFALPIIAITVYILIYYRSAFLPFAITGAAWFLGFVFYSWYHFGHWLPAYYNVDRLRSRTFWVALAGNLVSPGRGLLVFVPVILFVAFILLRYWRYIKFPRLVWLSLATISAHLVVISRFPHWWAGHSFGPRFSTGLVPWFVLLGVLGVDGMLKAMHSEKVSVIGRRFQSAAGVLLAVVSVLINTAGATQKATWLWNTVPMEIDNSTARLWDWHHPQFLANYVHSPVLNKPSGPTSKQNWRSGYVDGVDCDTIRGWVINDAHPDQIVAVEIYADDKLQGSLNADQFREDLLAARIGTGRYGFVYSIPRNLKDNKAHAIKVKPRGASDEVEFFMNTPPNIFCNPPLP